LHRRALVGISWRHGEDFWWRETWNTGVENNVRSKWLDARLDRQMGYILTVLGQNEELETKQRGNGSLRGRRHRVAHPGKGLRHLVSFARLDSVSSKYFTIRFIFQKNNYPKIWRDSETATYLISTFIGFWCLAGDNSLQSWLSDSRD
jgi:hypothetical protein